MQAERKVGSWVPTSSKDEWMAGSAGDSTEWGRMEHNLRIMGFLPKLQEGNSAFCRRSKEVGNTLSGLRIDEI